MLSYQYKEEPGELPEQNDNSPFPRLYYCCSFFGQKTMQLTMMNSFPGSVTATGTVLCSLAFVVKTCVEARTSRPTLRCATVTCSRIILHCRRLERCFSLFILFIWSSHH